MHRLRRNGGRTYRGHVIYERRAQWRNRKNPKGPRWVVIHPDGRKSRHRSEKYCELYINGTCHWKPECKKFMEGPED